jgi:hypothetical protein
MAIHYFKETRFTAPTVAIAGLSRINQHALQYGWRHFISDIFRTV